MVKFKATNAESKPILGIGLSQGNIDRLLKGMPIVFKPADVDLPWDGEIVILPATANIP